MFSLVKTAHAAVSTAAFGAVVDPIISNVVLPVVMLAFAVAIVVFIYGVLQMVINPVDAEAHKKGKVSMLSGLIGLFIMVSAWGIINLISNTVGQITSH
jgi:hypothetical protein